MRTEIQDFIDQEAPSGLQLSPDGRFGAFVVTKPDGEENCYQLSARSPTISEFSSISMRRL